MGAIVLFLANMKTFTQNRSYCIHFFLVVLCTYSLYGQTYAKGFRWGSTPEGYKTLAVRSSIQPEKWTSYVLIPRAQHQQIIRAKSTYKQVISLPVASVVLTSTTQIPAMEALGALNKVRGFTGLSYISSQQARNAIEKGSIKEVGASGNLDIETVLELAPELIVGYTMDQTPGFVGVLSKAQIPTLLFQDWQEHNPLGRTEWIKVMGVLLDKETEANTYFNQVVDNYERVKKIAQRAKTLPTVISGAVYQDVWYVPGGKSWMATLFSDAQADYLFKHNDQTGSLALSVETVIEKAHQAAFWIAPAQHTSWREMKSDQPSYTAINAFTQKKVITYALNKGPTGGVLYFEQAALRPDWVLSDLVYFLHPGIMTGYTPHFFNYTTP